MDNITDCKNSIILPNPITQVASMPYPLYISLQGKYFVGHSGNIKFDTNTSAWAGLVNPNCSGINLHVYVWTVTNYDPSPINAQVWLNSTPPGHPTVSKSVTPVNTALCPLPKPKAKIIRANNVTTEPKCGAHAYSRIIPQETTIADEEDGKFILPPGGSFIIFLSNLKTPNKPVEADIAFGWYEEKIKH